MAGEDKPKLNSANDNLWYCLATLHGEADETKPDGDLAARNRTAWNRWAAAGLDVAKRQALVEKGYSEAELTPFSGEEAAEFCRAFLARVGKNAVPPDPSKIIDFFKTLFERPLILSGCAFPSPAVFSSTSFSTIADFNSTIFFSIAVFNSAIFSTVADFRATTFLAEAIFGLTIFSASALFSDTKFSSKAAFGWANFSGYASFNTTTFSDYAFFRSASFSADVSFRSVVFLTDADFRLSTFSGDADFRSATFSADADFIEVKLGGRTSFGRAVFKSDVPDFRAATFHEATELDDVTWPPAPAGKFAARQQVYAYQRLKQEMEKLKKHEDELVFFRKELRARRGTYRRLSPSWCLNALYDVSSSYGQSVAKPLAWLLALFILGAIVFAGIGHAAALTPQDAFALSFSDIFGLLGVKRDFFAAATIAMFPRAIIYISAAQSIIGTILLFLSGLALRNRFRIK